MPCLLHIGKISGSSQNARIEIARETGEIKVFSRKTVVADVTDSNLEISLEEAAELDRKSKREI